jgi:hypothetical protein
VADDSKTPCIFCGALRSPSDALCASCGEAWIDEYVTPPPPEPALLHDVDDVDDEIDDPVDDTGKPGDETRWDDRVLEEDTEIINTRTEDTDHDEIEDTWSEDTDHDDDNDWDEAVTDDEIEDTWSEDTDHDDDNDWHKAVAEDDAITDTDDDDWNDTGFAADDDEEPDYATVTSSSVATEVTMTPIHTPYEPKERRSRIPLGLIAITALGVIAWLSWFRTDVTSPPATTVVAQTTSTIAQTTTVPPTSSTPPTTPPSTTTPSTTLPPPTTFPPIVAIGSPVPLADMTMGGFVFGPFPFGANGEQVLGRLTATFGQPDTWGPADTTWGLCATDSGSVATWGGIAAIFRDVNGSSEFVGYRIGDATGIDDGDPGGELTTLSGVSIGDTVASMRLIYANSTIELYDIDGQPYFRLLRSETQRLLLYGPISVQSDDGSILGIYSKDACTP